MKQYGFLIFLVIVAVLTACAPEVGNLASSVDLNSSQAAVDEDAGSGTISSESDETEIESDIFSSSPEIFPILTDSDSIDHEHSGKLDLKSNKLMIDLNNNAAGNFRIEVDFAVEGELPPSGSYSIDITDGSGNVVGTITLEVSAAGEITASATVSLDSADATLFITWPDYLEDDFANSGLYITGLRIYDADNNGIGYDSGDTFDEEETEEEATGPFSSTPGVYAVLPGENEVDAAQSGALNMKDNNLMVNLNNSGAGDFTIDIDFEITGEAPEAGVYTIVITDAEGNEVGTMTLEVSGTGEVSSSVTITAEAAGLKLFFAWDEASDSSFDNTNLYIKGITITDAATGTVGYDSGETFSTITDAEESSEPEGPFTAEPRLFPLTAGSTSVDNGQSGALNLKKNDLMINLNNSSAGSFEIEVDFEITGLAPAAGVYEILITDASGNQIGTLRLEISTTGIITSSATISVSEPGAVIYLKWSDSDSANFINTYLYIKGVRINDTASGEEGYNSGDTFSTITDADEIELEPFSAAPVISALTAGTTSVDGSQNGALNMKKNDLKINLNNNNPGTFRIEADFEVFGTIPPSGKYTLIIKDASGNEIGTIQLTVSAEGVVTGTALITVTTVDADIYLSWPQGGSSGVYADTDLYLKGLRIYDTATNTSGYNSGAKFSTITDRESESDSGSGGASSGGDDSGSGGTSGGGEDSGSGGTSGGGDDSGSDGTSGGEEYDENDDSDAAYDEDNTTIEALALAIDGDDYVPGEDDSVNLKYYDLMIDVNNRIAGKYKIEIDFRVDGPIMDNEHYKIDIVDENNEVLGIIKLNISKKGTIRAKGRLYLLKPNARIMIAWETARINKNRPSEISDLEIIGARFYGKKSDLNHYNSDRDKYDKTIEKYRAQLEKYRAKIAKEQEKDNSSSKGGKKK